LASLDARPISSDFEEPTTRDIERRIEFVNLQKDDVLRITAAQPVVAARVDDYVNTFFEYLAGLEEAAPLFLEPAILEEAKQLKREHLLAMVEGRYGQSYVVQRLRLGNLYGRVGLDVRVFLGAYHYLMTAIGRDVMAHFAADPKGAFEIFVSMKKLGFFDIAIIVDVLIDQRERVIAAQQEAIRELSTPVLQLRDGLLILPLVGTLDAKRARQLTADLLSTIRALRARVVVMDVTGIGGLDSIVSNHLVQTIEAARLMGAAVIVTGLSPEVAQSLVMLGVELSGVDTVGDLQGGIEKAEKLLGYVVSRPAGVISVSSPQP
jgi:rsbT co-antagonist protein RsbR